MARVEKGEVIPNNTAPKRYLRLFVENYYRAFSINGLIFIKEKTNLFTENKTALWKKKKRKKKKKEKEKIKKSKDK